MQISGMFEERVECSETLEADYIVERERERLREWQVRYCISYRKVVGGSGEGNME